MHRCVIRAATLLALAAAFCAPALAQAVRKFPANALRGEITITQPPHLVLNQKIAAQLAPGARIRGMDNMQVLSGALIGARLMVHYTIDPTSGTLLDVWILTAQEYARKPWPATPAEAATWRFNPDAQVWSKP